MNLSKLSDSHLSMSRHESSHSTTPIAPVEGLEDAEEKTLLHLIKVGTNEERKQAVSIIYDRHCDRVAKMIDRKGIKKADAEDIFGEVWKVALEKMPRFEYQGIPIWHWLSRITHIQIDAYFRQQKEQNGRLIETEDEWLETLTYVENLLNDHKNHNLSPHIKNLIDQTLPELIATLSSTEKVVIACAFYQEMDSTQIAKKLNMKPGTVRQQKRRALVKLKQWGAKEV